MIDTARLNELRNEVGAEDFAQVIELFCEEVEETLERILGGSKESLASDLHFLKGSALNIGMSHVAELCRKAEEELVSNSAASLETQQIKQAFDESRKHLPDC